MTNVEVQAALRREYRKRIAAAYVVFCVLGFLGFLSIGWDPKWAAVGGVFMVMSAHRTAKTFNTQMRPNAENSREISSSLRNSETDPVR